MPEVKLRGFFEANMSDPLDGVRTGIFTIYDGPQERTSRVATRADPLAAENWMTFRPHIEDLLAEAYRLGKEARD